MRGNNAAVVGSKKAGLEVKGTKKMVGTARDRNSNGPSNGFGRVSSPSRGEELNIAEVHNTIKGDERNAITLWPPAVPRMPHSFIGKMLEQELDMVDAGGGRIGAVRVGSD